MEPPDNVPYEISVCSAKSAAFSIGVIILSTVRKAARFAVYEEIMIKVKNHQIPPTMRVDVAWFSLKTERDKCFLLVKKPFIRIG